MEILKTVALLVITVTISGLTVKFINGDKHNE